MPLQFQYYKNINNENFTRSTLLLLWVKLNKIQSTILHQFRLIQVIMSPIYCYIPSTILFTRDGRTTGPEVKSRLPPVFRVLLEHSHTHIFRYCLWLPPHYICRVGSVQHTSNGLKSLKYWPSGPLRTSLMTSALCHYFLRKNCFWVTRSSTGKNTLLK